MGGWFFKSSKVAISSAGDSLIITLSRKLCALQSDEQLFVLAVSFAPLKAVAMVTTDWTGAAGVADVFLCALFRPLGLVGSVMLSMAWLARMGAFWTRITRLKARHLRHRAKYMVHCTYINTTPPDFKRERRSLSWMCCNAYVLYERNI